MEFRLRQGADWPVWRVGNGITFWVGLGRISRARPKSERAGLDNPKSAPSPNPLPPRGRGRSAVACRNLKCAATLPLPAFWTSRGKVGVDQRLATNDGPSHKPGFQRAVRRRKAAATVE